MTSEIDKLVGMTKMGTYAEADVDAVRAFLGLPPANLAANPSVFASRPQLSPHVHTISHIPVPSHDHQITIGFDGSKFEEQIYTVINSTNGLKHLAKYYPLDNSSIQETTMTVQLRTPSETIDRKDLLAGLQIAGSSHPDEVMHAVALVQDLTEGQTIVRGHQLKEGVIGRYIEVIDTGDKGYLSDWREHHIRENYKANAVINGKMVEIERNHYIIVDPAEA